MGIPMAAVAATGRVIYKSIGDAHAFAVVPAPVEGCKVGDTLPAGSVQFVDNRIQKVEQLRADPTVGTPDGPSGPRDRTDTTLDSVIPDVGVGYAALSLGQQEGRHPALK